MIRQILPIIAAACMAPCFAAEGWLTDMDAARKEAAEQEKNLMIEFTGSDWCAPCMQLRANVLTKPDFQQEARKNFVLLELDYPRRKEQSAEVKAANRKLAEQYGVTSFPTIVFADASGKPFGGFVGGRPREDVMKAMQDALKNKEALQAAEAEVAKASTDEAKVAALMEVLKLAPKDYVDNFYGDVKAEIKKLDKDDKSGLKAADAHADQLKKEQKEVQDYLAGKITAKTPSAEALQAVRAYPNRDKLLPEPRQDLMMAEFRAYLDSTGDVDGAVLMLDKVVELAPDTETGRYASLFKIGILANKDRVKARVDAARKKQDK